ncbi:MAG: ribonuclease BN [Desulfobulbus propionicus]|nr:MAG: ribonuclease BN [Desulfobulbus propionicus]
MNQTHPLWNRVSAWVFTQNISDNNHVRVIRLFLRIILIVWREAGRAKLSIRASALTYSVILSMVPLLAMSTALLKGLGSGDQIRVATERFIEQFDPRPTYPTETASTESPEDQLPSSGHGSNMTSHLYRAIDTIFDYVDKTNFAALGVIGIAGTLVVVVTVFSNIEAAMNDIWREKKGRPIFRKVMDYLALLVLLPISINMALAGEAILASKKMMGYLEKILPIPFLINALLKLLPFMFVILSLMLMYLFFSRARVRTPAAFIGAFFASVFWFATQKMYIFLQIGVAKYNAIYGSFATVPLFLVWVYLGWTFILLGAALAYAVQNNKDYIPHDSSISSHKSLQLAFDIIRQIYIDFAAKTKTTDISLLKALPYCSTAELELTLKMLQQSDLIRIVENKKTNDIFPATDITHITPSDILDTVFNAQEHNTYGSKMSQTALQGARKALPPQLSLTDLSHGKNDGSL